MVKFDNLENLFNTLEEFTTEYRDKPTKAKATTVRKILLSISKETHEIRKDILEATKKGYRNVAV